MITNILGIVYFILKAAFLVVVAFFGTNALRKTTVRRSTAMLFIIATGLITAAGYEVTSNPELTKDYFEDPAKGSEDNFHFTGGDADKPVLAQGQAGFLKDIQIIMWVVAVFFTLSVVMYVFGDPVISFRLSVVGVGCALLGLTFI
jgi:magnesium-transporting ATPase (P-type)